MELCVSLIRHVSDARHMCDFANSKSTDKFCLTEYGTAYCNKTRKKRAAVECESCEGELIMNVLATLVSRSWSAFVWSWIDAKELRIFVRKIHVSYRLTALTLSAASILQNWCRPIFVWRLCPSGQAPDSCKAITHKTCRLVVNMSTLIWTLFVVELCYAPRLETVRPKGVSPHYG